MEKLEQYAKFMIYAESLGGPRLLTRTQLDELYRLAPIMYGLNIHEKNRF
jgi:hypothetical protein